MLLRPSPTTTAHLTACVRSSHLPYSTSFWTRPRKRASYGFSRLQFCGPAQKRHVHIPNVLLPPVIFTGLVLALYTWKSFVMIALQNKIIYNPYLPPTARHDTISDYKNQHRGIQWEEVHMRSIDGTDLALAVASASSFHNPDADKPDSGDLISHHVYILFLQGPSVSVILRQRGIPTSRG